MIYYPAIILNFVTLNSVNDYWYAQLLSNRLLIEPFREVMRTLLKHKINCYAAHFWVLVAGGRWQVVWWGFQFFAPSDSFTERFQHLNSINTRSFLKACLNSIKKAVASPLDSQCASNCFGHQLKELTRL